MLLGIGAVSLFMSCVGVYITACCIINLIEEFNSADLSGLIFMLFWTSIVMCMSFHGFYAGGKRVTIDESGVSLEMLFIKKHYDWSEIADFGISYSGRMRNGERHYDLYFSKIKQKEKDKYKKKLKGSMIRTFVFGDEYYKVLREIFTFCNGRTSVEPFVSHD